MSACFGQHRACPGCRTNLCLRGCGRNLGPDRVAVRYANACRNGLTVDEFANQTEVCK